jgi:hypothetical protein
MTEFFVVFLSPYRKMPGRCVKLGHCPFVSDGFQFSIDDHPVIERCKIRDTDWVVK